MPNPSEMQRQLEEERERLSRYIPKADKERILGKIRELEKKLGIKPRPYNSSSFN